jgi:hypothetical protein
MWRGEYAGRAILNTPRNRRLAMSRVLTVSDAAAMGAIADLVIAVPDRDLDGIFVTKRPSSWNSR